MRKTKIVCTIGPASEDPDILRSMMLAGMNVVRLNFSHGSHEEHRRRIRRIKQLREELGIPVAIMLDTRGPEIRIGRFAESPVNLTEGGRFILTSEPIEGSAEAVYVNYSGLPSLVKKGDRIFLDDGLIELCVESSAAGRVECTVVNGGPISDNKSVNLPDVQPDMPYLSEKDRADILFAVENELEFIALSFVRSAEDVLDVKRFLSSSHGTGIELIAKIENRSGINQIDDIIRVSSGIMVARGDMGVEIPFEELPHIQKQLITKCYSAGKWVITATQMLESMVRNPRPTRAEITDVANAVYDGTSALMLSGETASGRYPVEALKTMVKIAERTEQSINYKEKFEKQTLVKNSGITDAISHATCSTAHDLEARAIVTVTRSGSTARMISRFRPATDIVAITPNPRTCRQLSLSWGVRPLMNAYRETSEELFRDAVERVTEAGLASDGDVIVITGSTDGAGGLINSLQVNLIGSVLLRGKGNNRSTVTGNVCVADENGDLSRSFCEGDLLVLRGTTPEVLPYIKRAGGVITEEELSRSGAAAACVAMEIPLISSATGALRLLKTGSCVTIDTDKGIVYAGDIIKEDNKGRGPK